MHMEIGCPTVINVHSERIVIVFISLIVSRKMDTPAETSANKIHKCSICDKEFENSFGLLAHSRWHKNHRKLPPKDLYCQFCEEHFTN